MLSEFKEKWLGTVGSGTGPSLQSWSQNHVNSNLTEISKTSSQSDGGSSSNSVVQLIPYYVTLSIGKRISDSSPITDVHTVQCASASLFRFMRALHLLEGSASGEQTRILTEVENLEREIQGEIDRHPTML